MTMTVLWGVLAGLGALAFLVGVNSTDAAHVWSIYLVNLVFWSGLAGPRPARRGNEEDAGGGVAPPVPRTPLPPAGFPPRRFRAAPRPLHRWGDALPGDEQPPARQGGVAKHAV